MFDAEGSHIPIEFLNASPLVKGGGPDSGPEMAIDGNPDTMTHNRFGPGVAYGREDHWMKFLVRGEIGSVEILNRSDWSPEQERCDPVPSKRIQGCVLSLSTLEGTLLAQYTIATQGVGHYITCNGPWSVWRGQ